MLHENFILLPNSSYQNFPVPECASAVSLVHLTFVILTNGVGNGTLGVKKGVPPIRVIYKLYELRITVYKQIVQNFYIYDIHVQRGLMAITKQKMLI